MSIEWTPCTNPRCSTKIAIIDGAIMQREWAQNGSKLLGYRFHNCAEAVTLPIERVFHVKWVRKNDPTWPIQDSPQGCFLSDGYVL